jgi:hypothetical protein
MPVIDVPGTGLVEFSDEMSMDDIQSVLDEQSKELVSREVNPLVAQPRLGPQATLPDVLSQPTPILNQQQAGVVPSALPGVMQPSDLLQGQPQLGQPALDASQTMPYVPPGQPTPEQSGGILNNMALGAGKGFLQEAGPGIMKALGALSELVPPISTGPGSAYVPQNLVKEQLRRTERTPAQIAQDTQNNPLYQAGKTAQEYWKATIPTTPQEEESLAFKGPEQATAMAGYLASGPAAPLLIGAESYADHIVNDYEDLKKNLGEEKAGEVAMQRAIQGGLLQAAVFEFLPKPLRKLGEKFIVDKFGSDALAKFVGKRVASAATTGQLFTASKIAENLNSGKDPTEGVAESEIGGILFGAVTPFGKTKQEVEQRAERQRRYSESSPEEQIQAPDISPEKKLELQNQIDLRKRREQSVIDTEKETGRKVIFTDGNLEKGQVTITHPDGTIEVDRKNFHNWADINLEGKDTKDAISRMVNQEVVHGGMRTLPDGDRRAGQYWNGLSKFEQWVESKYYDMRGLNDVAKGHEAIRRRYEAINGMSSAELLEMSKAQQWSLKSLDLMADAVRAMREQKGSFDSRRNQVLLRKLDENINKVREGAKDASSIPSPEKAAEREVRPPVGQEAPLRQQGEAAPAQEAVAQAAPLPLEEVKQAPPSAQTVEAQPPAQATGKAETVEPTKATAAEPAISEPKPVEQKAQAQGLTPEQTELKTLREKLRNGPLDPNDADRMDELVAKGVRMPRPKKAPAMRMANLEQVNPEDKTGSPRYYGTDEDVNRYEELQRQQAAARASGNLQAMFDPERGKATEALKNKYGGSPPVRKPKALAPDMESARRVSSMSDSDFMRLGSSFNKTNLELGEKATGEQVAELKQLHAKAQDELKTVLDKGNNNTATPEDINRLPVLFSKVQYFSEAIQAAPVEAGGSGRENAPAMRFKDMSEEDLGTYLTPLMQAAGGDPVKEQAAIDFVRGQIAKEEEAQFQAEQGPLPEITIGPEDPASPLKIGVELAAGSYIDGEIEAKQISKPLEKPESIEKAKPVTAEYKRPTFNGMVAELRKTMPGLTEDSVRWLWAEKVTDHLMNASGKRLEDWRKAMKLEGPRRYGTRRIADPAREKTAEEKRDIAIATGKMTESEALQYGKEAPKLEASQQNYRMRLITEIRDRLYKEALPEISSELIRKEITLDDIAFDNDSTKFGAYRSFSSGEGKDVGYLENNLDDEARVSKHATPTKTKRVTVLVNKKNGNVELVSTYKHPRSKRIMLYDPIIQPQLEGGEALPIGSEPRTEKQKQQAGTYRPPGMAKAHHTLQSLLPLYRVKASILLRDPVQNFHMRIEKDPETGKSAEQVYMDAIGDQGARFENGVDPIWMEFQHEKGPEPALEDEPRPSSVERGEGGSFTGPESDIARANAGILRSKLQYFSKGPMTSTEARGLILMLSDMEVSSPKDIEYALNILADKANNVDPITKKRYILRGDEYCAISAIDKVIRKHYSEIMEEGDTKEDLQRIKDPTARKKFLEGVKIEAYSRARNEIYDIADKTKREFGTGEEKRMDFDPKRFGIEAINRFGDKVRRTAEQAKAQEKPASGREILDLRTARPRQIPPRRHWLEPLGPQARAPAEQLPPEGQKYAKELSRGAAPAPMPSTIYAQLAHRGAETTRQTGFQGFDRRPPEQQQLRPILNKKVTQYQGTLGQEARGRDPNAPAMKAGSGPSARAQDALAEEGRAYPIEALTGVNPQEAREHGRELIKAGGDPIMAMTEFKETGKVGYDQMALVVAHGDDLQIRLDKAIDKNPKSDEARSLKRESALWQEGVKQMANALHKSFVSLQGTVDVDTGSFSSMQRAFGKDFTPKQERTAKVHVEKTKKADAEFKDTVQKMDKIYNAPTKLDPQVESIANRILTQLKGSGMDALAKFKAKRGTPSMKTADPNAPAMKGGLDKEDLDLAAEYGAFKMASMSKDNKLKVSEWKKQMVADMGPEVAPHLDEIWDASDAKVNGIIKTQIPEKIYEPVQKVLTQHDPKATLGVDDVRKIMGTVKPGKVSPEAARALWNYTKKNYLDVDGPLADKEFATVRRKVAIDLGMSTREVTEALAANKTARKMTDELYRKTAQQRRVVSDAKNWLKNEKLGPLERGLRKIPRVFFIDKIFGHGTVGLITHAGNMVFNPRAWNAYFPQWIEMFKMVRPTKAGEAYHEKKMQELRADPLFTRGRRAGLQNDPFKHTDDYQIVWFHKHFGGLVGNRGFDALKLLRQARFNQLVNGTPASLQGPLMDAMWADDANHSSGIIKSNFSGKIMEPVNWLAFAPKLEGSRWAWMLHDPVKAMNVFRRIAAGAEVAPEEKLWATSVLKDRLTVSIMYASLLAMNQGILKAVGSDQEVNWKDPTKPDYLSFKIAGFNVGVVGPMIGMVKLTRNLWHDVFGHRTKFEQLTPRFSASGAHLLKYARGKASPFASFGITSIYGSDPSGRQVPWNTDKVSHRDKITGRGRMGYGEYAANEFLPIPLEETAREVFKGYGMDDHSIKMWSRALIGVGLPTALTGVRVSEDESR